jgi:hypothetical protein
LDEGINEDGFEEARLELDEKCVFGCYNYRSTNKAPANFQGFVSFGAGSLRFTSFTLRVFWRLDSNRARMAELSTTTNPLRPGFFDTAEYFFLRNWTQSTTFSRIITHQLATGNRLSCCFGSPKYLDE